MNFYLIELTNSASYHKSFISEILGSNNTRVSMKMIFVRSNF